MHCLSSMLYLRVHIIRSQANVQSNENRSVGVDLRVLILHRCPGRFLGITGRHLVFPSSTSYILTSFQHSIIKLEYIIKFLLKNP